MPSAQLSDIAVQVTHIAPPPPHACVVGGATQVLPLQQPDRQLVESHTHAPFMQCWPAAQAAFAPHLQVPFAQVSALVPQPLHAEPFAPHAVTEGLLLQTPLVQHPVQLVELQPLQLPLVQLWPVGHV
jgi:hypothetical protein